MILLDIHKSKKYNINFCLELNIKEIEKKYIRKKIYNNIYFCFFVDDIINKKKFQMNKNIVLLISLFIIECLLISEVYTVSQSSTRTPSRTPTPSNTRTPSRTASPTVTPTPSVTPSTTPSPCIPYPTATFDPVDIIIEPTSPSFTEGWSAPNKILHNGGFFGTIESNTVDFGWVYGTRFYDSDIWSSSLITLPGIYYDYQDIGGMDAYGEDVVMIVTDAATDVHVYTYKDLSGTITFNMELSVPSVCTRWSRGVLHDGRNNYAFKMGTNLLSTRCRDVPNAIEYIVFFQKNYLESWVEHPISISVTAGNLDDNVGVFIRNDAHIIVINEPLIQQVRIYSYDVCDTITLLSTITDTDVGGGTRFGASVTCRHKFPNQLDSTYVNMCIICDDEISYTIGMTYYSEIGRCYIFTDIDTATPVLSPNTIDPPTTPNTPIHFGGSGVTFVDTFDVHRLMIAETNDADYYLGLSTNTMQTIYMHEFSASPDPTYTVVASVDPDPYALAQARYITGSYYSQESYLFVSMTSAQLPGLPVQPYLLIYCVASQRCCGHCGIGGDIAATVDACTFTTCTDAGAVFNSTMDCDDVNSCTTDNCDSILGCRNTINAEFSACEDDGNPCSTDLCSEFGCCVHTTYSCTPTPTPTVTPTSSNTPSTTMTATPTPTPTSTVSESSTPSPTETMAPTTTTTLTATPTPSQTPTISETNTPTVTPTPSTTTTLTATPTISNSATPTVSESPTPSNTPTTTLTAAASPSNTPSISETNTPTPSNSPTPSTTESLSSTMTLTATPTISDSMTPTPSTSFSNTPSISQSITPSPTITPSTTSTLTESPTPTGTPTTTTTQTITATTTPTPSTTITESQTPTPSNTPSSSQTRTNSRTASQTPTPTPSNTPSNTPTPTNTPTSTSTPTPTNTPSNTPTSTTTTTLTATPTPTTTTTLTATPTISNSATPSISESATPSSSPGASQSNTPSISETPSVTPSPSTTMTLTSTPTVSESSSPTPTSTLSLSSSPTNTITRTPSSTPTGTASNSPVPTSSSTSSVSRSPTPSVTPSSTPCPPPGVPLNCPIIDTQCRSVTNDTTCEILDNVFGTTCCNGECNGFGECISISCNITDDTCFGMSCAEARARVFRALSAQMAVMDMHLDMAGVNGDSTILNIPVMQIINYMYEEKTVAEWIQEVETLIHKYKGPCYNESCALWTDTMYPELSHAHAILAELIAQLGVFDAHSMHADDIHCFPDNGFLHGLLNFEDLLGADEFIDNDVNDVVSPFRYCSYHQYSTNKTIMHSIETHLNAKGSWFSHKVQLTLNGSFAHLYPQLTYQHPDKLLDVSSISVTRVYHGDRRPSAYGWIEGDNVVTLLNSTAAILQDPTILNPTKSQRVINTGYSPLTCPRFYTRTIILPESDTTHPLVSLDFPPLYTISSITPNRTSVIVLPSGNSNPALNVNDFSISFLDIPTGYGLNNTCYLIPGERHDITSSHPNIINLISYLESGGPCPLVGCQDWYYTPDLTKIYSLSQNIDQYGVCFGF